MKVNTREFNGQKSSSWGRRDKYIEKREKNPITVKWNEFLPPSALKRENRKKCENCKAL